MEWRETKEKDNETDSPRPTFDGTETQITMNLCVRTRKYKKKLNNFVDSMEMHVLFAVAIPANNGPVINTDEDWSRNKKQE